MYGSGMEGVFWAMLVMAALAGAAFVLALVWLLPWLWSLVKPWLHVVTA